MKRTIIVDVAKEKAATTTRAVAVTATSAT